MTNSKIYSLYLNGFLNNLASNLEQNRSNPSPARVLCRASLPSTLAGQLALFQIAPGDLVPIFVQPSLPDFPEKSIPFMKHPG